MKLLDQIDQHQWLREHVSRWVTAGVVSSAQADAIVEFETSERLEGLPATRRLTVGSEVVIYVGSLLALMGGAFVVARTWESMPVVARIAVGVVIAVVGLLGGRALHTLGEAGADRLAGFMWLVAAGGVALATGVSVDAVGVDTPKFVALAVGAAVLAVGALLWRNLERPLQFLTTVAGLVVVMIATAAHVGLRTWVGGVLLWACAIVTFVVAAGDRLRPQLVALVVAAVGALAASAMVSDLSERLAPIVGLATAAGLVGSGLVLHRTPVLVVGVLGLLVYLQMLFALYFAGPLAAATVAIVGLGVVVIALMRTTRRARSEPARTGEQ